MTANNGGEQQENLVDFFDPALWLARVDGMVWLLRMTYDVMEGALGGLEGLSVEKCTQLIQEIERKKVKPEALDLDFDLLETFLKGWLQKGTLPVTAPTPNWAVDFDFELKQLINLRSLTITYIYFFADMRRLIEEALAPPTGQGEPPLHLIQACYQYLANDFEILQRAFLQRQPSVDPAGKPVAGVLAKELVMTDKLAMKTLLPFAHLLAHPTIFTFFSQETHIRQLPFSDQVILVGLSHGRISITYNEQMRSDAAENGRTALPAFELLAIPHEIGHYLYDHAQLDRPAAAHNAPTKGHFIDLCAQFRDNPYHHWGEELFADLFGCVVAGPLAVLGMQALLATGDPASLWQDDGEHPTAAVRPYLLAEMLRVLAGQEKALAQQTKTVNPARYQFAQAAHSLDANWSATLQRLGFALLDVKQGRPAQIKLPAHAAGVVAVIEVDQLVKTVTPILVEFAGHLLAQARFELGHDPLSAAMPWVRTDQARLRVYTDALVALTGAALARQPVAQQHLLSLNFWDEKWQSHMQGATATEKLQHWLDEWGDRGPRTIGGH